MYDGKRCDLKILSLLKNTKVWVLTAAVLLIIFIIFSGMDSRLKIVKYDIKSEKIHSPVHLAVVSDLHSCYYGDGQNELVDMIIQQNPDILLYAGDILDDKMPDDNAVILLKALQDKYPSYYVTGNHEYWSREPENKIRIMRDYGVKVLQGEWDNISINGQTINICGIDDPDVDRYTTPQVPFDEQLKSLKNAADNGGYTILLSHRPELINEYARYPFDLILSGHAHGGQWRVPGIINGIFSPNQGFFPRYAGGRYNKNGMTMIVSRGLAKESTKMPRIYNRPELAIVDLAAE